MQYYFAARSTARPGVMLMPVSGNLDHHSLELFLKSGLARNKYSLAGLKKLRHQLTKIWDEFRENFPSPDLAQFDTTIGSVAKFEEIRYPNDDFLKRGASMSAVWGRDPRDFGPEHHSSSLPWYHLDTSDLDRLVAEIFRASSAKKPLLFLLRGRRAGNARS